MTRSRESLRGWLPWLWTAAVTTAAATQLRLQGRLWICDCGRVLPWFGDAWGSQTSQHFLDPYSFTHVLHGLAFCGLLTLCLPRLHWSWRFALAITAEALWEVIENTDAVINRYREATAALGYSGDTVINSLGDIFACAIGVVIAQRLGWARSIILLVLIEVMLVVWIRDSLLMNILMLVYPIDELREWQSGR
jgi:hypothetical protein